MAGVFGFLLEGEGQCLMTKLAGGKSVKETTGLTHPKLCCIANIPLEQDDGAKSVFADQSLDLRTGRETVKADSKELKTQSVNAILPSSCSTIDAWRGVKGSFSHLSDFPAQGRGGWHWT